MKHTIVSLALFGMASAVPCAAQVSPAPVPLSRTAMQALVLDLFRHSGSGHAPQTPQQKARVKAYMERIYELDQAGAEALHAGDFTAAEAYYRELTEVDSYSRDAHYKLGDALAGQGQVKEAIEAYRAGIYGPPYTVTVLNDIPLHGQFNPAVRVCPGGGEEVSWIKYALLLSQTGQVPEAVALYKQALPRVPDADLLTTGFPFGKDAPTPEIFQAAAHVALGLCATFSGSNYEEAMSHFDLAQHLRPDAPLTNYYYGYGWHNLNPQSRAKVANALRAKAALQKAAASGQGEVKKAAEEALVGIP